MQTLHSPAPDRVSPTGAETPDNTVQLGRRNVVTETPDDTLLDTTRESSRVRGRAANLGIFSDKKQQSANPVNNNKTKSVVKTKTGSRLRQLPADIPSEQSFVL